MWRSMDWILSLGLLIPSHPPPEIVDLALDLGVSGWLVGPVGVVLAPRHYGGLEVVEVGFGAPESVLGGPLLIVAPTLRVADERRELLLRNHMLGELFERCFQARLPVLHRQQGEATDRDENGEHDAHGRPDVAPGRAAALVQFGRQGVQGAGDAVAEPGELRNERVDAFRQCFRAVDLRRGRAPCPLFRTRAGASRWDRNARPAAARATMP